MNLDRKTVTRTRHYHVAVGPAGLVNLYNIKNLDMAGPYYDIIVDDAEEAVCLWADTANNLFQEGFEYEQYIEWEEIEDIVEQIVEHEPFFEYSEEDEPNVGFAVGEGDQHVLMWDCGGCVPKGNN